jgi:putative transposase
MDLEPKAGWYAKRERTTGVRVVFNPVHAKRVQQPSDWPWSSYHAMAGIADSPYRLETDALLVQFSDQLVEAREHYARFVAEGMGAIVPRRI